MATKRANMPPEGMMGGKEIKLPMSKDTMERRYKTAMMGRDYKEQRTHSGPPTRKRK